jgi:hypothetical protein
VGAVQQSVDEPLDPAELPIAHLGRPVDPDEPEQPTGSHLRLIVVVAALVVVVGFVVGVVLFNSSAPPLGRGAESADLAAGRYVTAVNAGDEKAAADIACDRFADDARAQAGTGADRGISFRLGRVRMVSKSDAVATLTERIEFPGGKSRAQPVALAISRSGGRWLICGRAG